MDRQDFVDAVAEDLFTYVMQGSISERHVASEIKPTGLDERFEDFDSLIDLHFVLRPDVVDFVEQLPRRLRSIKTQTRNVQAVSRGEISGRIRWDSTVKARAAQAPGDRSLFVCNTRNESYDIDENVVLKRLLSKIYTTLDECEAYLRQKYDWVTDQWRDNLELVDRLRNLFERNVHVTRIREPAVYEPTDRMLQTADSARNEIYREAASLLRDLRASKMGDRSALTSLLEDTIITPDDEETLFELYVLFQYVKSIENHQAGETTVATIETDRQEVARIESNEGTDVVLYHDSSARDRDLSFIPELRGKPESQLTRSERIQRQSREVVERYFKQDRFELHTNRPDVIVLELRHEDEYEYLITEVKHSTRSETIQRGVKETLEYLAFLRRDEVLVFEDESPFGSGWNGVLVVQDIDERETAGLNEQETIRIIQASELHTFIPEVLERVL
jgi:hypothetical protein